MEATDYRSTKWDNLIEVLRFRARETPNKIAYIFLRDGAVEASQLTYAELDKNARLIATLCQRRAVPGSRVILLYPAGLHFISAFFGCLYARLIAIPAPPLDPARLKRTLPRLQSIVRDADASMVLLTENLLARLLDVRRQVQEFGALPWEVTDNLDEICLDEFREERIAPGTIAYLQYTSGSTGSPKGTVIDHRNLVHHSRCLQSAWGYTPDSVAVTWMPHFHDYGLVDGLIQPLFSGIPSVIMSPNAFLKRPIRWLEAISRYRGTHSQGPNFAYEYCVRKTTEQQRLSLDLSSWKVASNGAEPIRAATVKRFVETFEPHGFRQDALYPAYGLAEATLLVSTKAHSEVSRTLIVEVDALESNRIVETQNDGAMVRDIVSCGRPIPDVDVAIVDHRNLTRCGPGEVGEIWVSSESVAQGYWQRTEETEKTFRACIRGEEGKFFLRTGDLGFLRNGELFVTGRLKSLIIIDGANYYPHDIEWTVAQSHPMVRPDCCAAFSIEEDGREKLIVIAEIEQRAQDDNLEQVVEAIKRAVAESHEIAVHAVSLLKKGEVLKTSSGKIQHHECRNNFLRGELGLSS